MKYSCPEIGINLTKDKAESLTEDEIKAYLELLNWTNFQREIPFVVLMALYFVLGVSGNSLTLYLYVTSFSKNTASPFYVAMAVYNLLTSGVCVPLDVYNSMWRNVNHESEPVCQLYRFFVNTVFVASILLLSIMAIDCYVKICHPFRSVDVRIKKISCIITGLTSIVVHIPMAYLVFGLTKVHTENKDVFGHKCLIKDTLQSEKIYAFYNKSLGVLFTVTLITLIVCYGLVFRTWRLHKNLKIRSPSDSQRSKFSGTAGTFYGFNWPFLFVHVRIKKKKRILTPKNRNAGTAEQLEPKPLPLLQLEVEQVEAGPSQAGALAQGFNSSHGIEDKQPQAKDDCDISLKAVQVSEKRRTHLVNSPTEIKSPEQIKSNPLTSSKLTISKHPQVKDQTEVNLRATKSFSESKQKTLQTSTKKVTCEGNESVMSADLDMVRTTGLSETFMDLFGNVNHNSEGSDSDVCGGSTKGNSKSSLTTHSETKTLPDSEKRCMLEATDVPESNTYTPISRETVLSFIALSIMFFVSYAFIAAVLQTDTNADKCVRKSLWRVFAFKLSYMNNCLSPLVYWYFNLSFRMEAKRVITGWKQYCVTRCT